MRSVQARVFLFAKNRILKRDGYRVIRCFSFLILCLLVTGCGPSTPEEFRQEGRSVTRSLIRELRQIASRSDLIAAESTLRQLFDELVDVMIEMREMQQEEGWTTPALSLEDRERSDALRLEFERLFGLEGGKKLLEAYQADALKRLDKAEYVLRKKQESLTIK